MLLIAALVWQIVASFVVVIIAVLSSLASVGSVASTSSSTRVAIIDMLVVVAVFASLASVSSVSSSWASSSSSVVRSGLIASLVALLCSSAKRTRLEWLNFTFWKRSLVTVVSFVGWLVLGKGDDEHCENTRAGDGVEAFFDGIVDILYLEVGNFILLMDSEEPAFDEFDDLDGFGNGVSCRTHDHLLSSFLEMAISIVEIREGGLVASTHPDLVWILSCVRVFRLIPLSVLLHEDCGSCLFIAEVVFNIINQPQNTKHF